MKLMESMKGKKGSGGGTGERLRWIGCSLLIVFEHHPFQFGLMLLDTACTLLLAAILPVAGSALSAV
jgi:hypothetical protein